MAESRIFRAFFLVLVAVGLYGCDRATKLAAEAGLEGGAAVPVAPGVLGDAVELRYVQNDDVAFSLFRVLGLPRSPDLLAGIAVAAIVAILVLAVLRYRSGGGGERAAQVGFALVIGGALGNVVDRIVRGYVIDFIHVKGWPVFNVADIAVVVGIALVGLASLRGRRRDAPPADAA